MGEPESSKPILIISGPTGSGKSKLAHILAEQFNLSILSADSRQIVSGFDIGSAKPNAAERRRYDYRMLDLIEPGQSYSAFEYARQAQREIKSVLQSGKVPLICGGSGLYIRALTDGIFETAPADPELRSTLEQQAEELGPLEFHALLKKVDPQSALAIHPHNVVRVVRALEIYYTSSQTKFELMSDQERPDYLYRQLALTPPIELVYERIGLHVDRMFRDGWESEVRSLIETYGLEKIRAARAIGYTELCDYLGEIAPFEETIELIKRNTRRFAKRQMTWLRGINDIQMYESAENLQIDAVNLLNYN